MFAHCPVIRLAITTLAALMCLAAAGSATALQFRYENVNPVNGRPYSNPDLRTLVMQGPIEKGDARRLTDFIFSDLQQYRRTGQVLIKSNGGNVNEAKEITNILKNSYRKVTVSRWFGSCVSACFFIVSGAVERNVSSGEVGLHRPFLPDDMVASTPLKELESLQKRIYDSARATLQDFGVPQYLIELMFSRASNEIYWMNDKDKTSLGTRAIWYEQVLVSRCHLNKEWERRSTADSPVPAEITAFMDTYYACQAKMKLEGADSYLKTLGAAR